MAGKPSPAKWEKREVKTDYYTLTENGVKLEVYSPNSKRFYVSAETANGYYYPMNLFFTSLDGCLGWFRAGIYAGEFR